MTPEQFCQLRHVFERAMQLPTQSRNAYIQNVCRDNTELLTEVERMVEAAGQSNAPIDCPALEVVTAECITDTA